MRRILDANVITNPNTNNEEILCSVYAEQIKLLNDAQLEFEYYKHQLGLFRNVFQNIGDLKSQAKAMESYLNNLIDEYQKLKFSGNASQSIEISNLPRLKEFLLTKTFRANFVLILHSTIELIQREIPDIY